MHEQVWSISSSCITAFWYLSSEIANDIIIYNGESMEEKKADKDFSL